MMSFTHSVQLPCVGSNRFLRHLHGVITPIVIRQLMVGVHCDGGDFLTVRGSLGVRAFDLPGLDGQLNMHLEAILKGDYDGRGQHSWPR